MKKILLVTSNPAKVQEFHEIMHIAVEIADIELDEIQEMDVEKIALHKLEEAYKKVKMPVVVDDVSFEVEAWDGFPGPLIKWILITGGAELLIKMLRHEKNRKARVGLVIGFHDGKKPHLFLGKTKGTIAKSVRGKDGFGWDKVFIPDGYKLTYAEMEPELKNSISHRGIALAKFKDFLKKNYGI
jgi:non-canonical purine NTP pyrophosphatase (RdgB/HAM1 family)